ncbi:hypothetical protein AGMMS50267_16300 [Spirochaetia bacterium]|nr:hypothetical protein AGMMS50267_16300 [Spirochaetia bacterium]
MIMVSRIASSAGQSEISLHSTRIEILRKKIDNEDYLYEAIQRLALILSNEILDIPHGGTYERQRKGRQ